MGNLSQPTRFDSGANHPEPSITQKLAAFVLHEFVEGVAALRTGDLIANLLDINAIEQFIARKERCDVGALIKQSLKNNQSTAAKKQIVFLSGISSGLWAKADRVALQQVLDNVISNAVKYSPSNSTIQVHALLENGNVIVNIRDEGTNIDETSRQKLFEKFSRLLACPAGNGFSTGTRLAIVKKLAEALSGSIRWRSALSSGSTFTLKLPVSVETSDALETSDIKMLACNILETPGSTPAFYSRN